MTVSRAERGGFRGSAETGVQLVTKHRSAVSQCVLVLEVLEPVCALWESSKCGTLTDDIGTAAQCWRRVACLLAMSLLTTV